MKTWMLASVAASCGLVALSPPLATAVLARQEARVALTITGARTHRFTVEVARTGEQQARGLMFRPKIAPNGGMLFPMSPPRVASFWMKDTPASLDIIFIRSDGRISSIAARTQPYSLAQIVSNEPVAAVLEIAGGRAAQLGIVPGNRVRWSPGAS